MGVLADTSENIQPFAPVRLRVFHAICCEERQSICARQMDQLAIDAFFTTNEMPLKFNENIFATKRIDKHFDRFVERLTCSLPLARFFNLPVDVARILAAPFCE